MYANSMHIWWSLLSYFIKSNYTPKYQNHLLTATWALLGGVMSHMDEKNNNQTTTHPIYVKTCIIIN